MLDVDRVTILDERSRLRRRLGENRQPYVTSFELFGRLARAVTNNSRQKPEYGVVRGAGDEGSGDFTFILRPGARAPAAAGLSRP